MLAELGFGSDQMISSDKEGFIWPLSVNGKSSKSDFFFLFLLAILVMD